MKIVKVLKTNLVAISSKDLLAELKNIIDTDKKRIKIAKVNSEFLLRALKFPEFAKTLDDFDINVADGVGVLWAAKYLSLPITDIPILKQVQAVWQMIYTGASLVFYSRYCKEPIPKAFRGADLMNDMLKFAEGNRISIYLFGTSKETLKKTISNLKTRYSKLEIAGYHEGYDFSDTKIVKDINRSKAQILFVALGSPSQEYWIRDNISDLNSLKIAVGEGGSFEFIAGTYKRAPKWMRTLGLEWLFRLFANKNTTATERSRFRRVWKAVPVFVFNVVRFKLNSINNQ